MSGHVVRELVALFVSRVDNSSFHAVEKHIERLKHAMIGVGAGLLAHDLYELGEHAARFADARNVFVQAGGDIEDLRKKTRGLVSDFKLVKFYNFAQQFGLGDKLEMFFLAANAASKKFAMSKEKALEQFIVGTALHSAPRLKMVGINVVGQKKQIEEAYAQAHHKSVASFTREDHSRAYAEEVARQSAMMIKQVGDAGESASDRFMRLHASVDNAKNALGLLLDAGLVPMLDKMIPLVNALRDFFDVLADPQRAGPDAVEKFGDLADVLRTIGAWVVAAARTFKMMYDTTLGKVVLALLGAVVAGKLLGGTLVSIGNFARWQIGPIIQLVQALWAMNAAELATAAGTAVMGAAFLGMLAILYVIGEEIYAIFNPDAVTGFFATWGGKWDDFATRLQKGLDEDDFWLTRALKHSLMMLAYLSQQFGHFIEWVNNVDHQGDAIEGKESSFYSPREYGDAQELRLRNNERAKIRAAAEEERRRQANMPPPTSPFAFVNDAMAPPNDVGVGVSYGAPSPGDFGEGWGVLAPPVENNVTVNMTVAPGYDMPTIEQTAYTAVQRALEEQSIEASQSTRSGGQ